MLEFRMYNFGKEKEIKIRKTNLSEIIKKIEENRDKNSKIIIEKGENNYEM